MKKFSHERYNELVSNTFDTIRELGRLKGGEYSGDVDRLANFRRNGEAQGLPMQAILGVYAAKHWDAIMQFIKDINTGTTRERMEPITGRVDDLIVYLLLFKAMCEEEAEPAAETVTWTPWGGRSKLSPVPDATLIEWWNDRRLPEQKLAGEIDWSSVFEYRVIESEWFNHDGTPFMPMILNDMTDIFIEYKTHSHRVHAIHARWSEVIRWRYA